MSAPPRTRARRRAGGAAAAREFDIVVYGASGFVGRQAVAHLAAHAGSLRWALAGRSQAKLEAVRQACGPGAAAAGIVVAVADDAPALAALAARARVVLSTAGPFAKYGDALVDACVAHRTHYVDITGETPWVRRLITRSIAIIPAAAVTILYGESETARLLILTQVVLSLQLSFAVVPLVMFTTDRRKMGALTAPPWLAILAVVIAAIIVVLNLKLLYDFL